MKRFGIEFIRNTTLATAHCGCVGSSDAPMMSHWSKSIFGAAFAFVITILLSTGCSDSSGPPPPPPPPPTLAVAVSHTRINAAWGSSDTTTANVSRGGYAGTLALTSAGAPAGVTVSFTPATIPANDTSSVLQVNVADSVAPGHYPIVIYAAGSGVTTATAILNVVIGGSFSLGPANSIALTVPAGGAAVISAIAITRTAPFTGAVALTVTGAPAGMTTSFSPASAIGATSTLSVTADATVANGTYALVVHGSGTDVVDTTASVAVTVTGSSVHLVYAGVHRVGYEQFAPAFFSATNHTTNPAVDTISLHGSIRWIAGSGSHGTMHTVRSTGVPSFIGTNTILTATGYAVVFDAAGTYSYECGIHGNQMTGTVVVR